MSRKFSLAMVSLCTMLLAAPIVAQQPEQGTADSAKSTMTTKKHHGRHHMAHKTSKKAHKGTTKGATSQDTTSSH